MLKNKVNKKGKKGKIIIATTTIVSAVAVIVTPSLILKGSNKNTNNVSVQNYKKNIIFKDAILDQNKKAVGDGSGNTYTQAQIDKAKGGNYVAPKNAIEGLNNDDVIYKKPSSKNLKLLNELVARIHAWGVLPNKFTFPKKDIEKAVKEFEKKIKWDKMNFVLNGNTYKELIIEEFKKWQKRDISIDVKNKKIKIQFYIDKPKRGDGSGNTYTKAEIAARDAQGQIPATPADANRAKVGLNAVGSVGAGDGSGNTYTQAEIDARDAIGIIPSSKEDAKKAKVGLNVKGTSPTGDGSGNTYTQAHIDKAKGGNYVAPKNAVEGKNIKSRINGFLSDQNFNIIYTALKNIDGGGGMNQPLSSNRQMYNNPKTFRIYINSSGRKGEWSKVQVAINGLVNWKRLKSKKYIYDDVIKYSKQYKFQLDLKNQIISFNLLPDKKAIGDGSSKTYTKAQIAARDAQGSYPSKDDATSGKATLGLNAKKASPTGDGSGNTYTQAQIDKALGLVAPDRAVVGKNKKATGDGTGITYTKAQIDSENKTKTPKDVYII